MFPEIECGDLSGRRWIEPFIVRIPSFVIVCLKSLITLGLNCRPTGLTTLYNLCCVPKKRTFDKRRQFNMNKYHLIRINVVDKLSQNNPLILI